MSIDTDSFGSKPLHRFFNVILFLLYSAATLLTISVTTIMFTNRPITKATVECRDKTSWNATDIYWDNTALCGICTNRNNDGSKYTNCSYGNIDYSSYNVTKQYGLGWETILFPIIAFIITFGFVDIIRIAVIYIISGQTRFDKSLLLKLLVLVTSKK